ncbi:uncharacterized protein LOC112346079 isoform X2 [Selaginella moellendorffii]|uniref:uncharacterized protein LOC112346079 isoform X2 n=1 Tax=Selaginella moellendorffii TaxID=88036 RepID=UPI000D1C97D5|nr:uncharacterized protein LOC112346079 isoform X2 [Selaginella moellendorffii]|eukprot:XP_024529910.1 uncharacterized protein LOC112346079 isoform X2 [Selaginella moellendorffii]
MPYPRTLIWFIVRTLSVSRVLARTLIWFVAMEPWVRRFLYSGDNKHVFIGVVTILGVGYIPWYFMTRGVKHSSHQDYMDKAEEARKARLST